MDEAYEIAYVVDDETRRRARREEGRRLRDHLIAIGVLRPTVYVEGTTPEPSYAGRTFLAIGRDDLFPGFRIPDGRDDWRAN